MKFNVQAGFMVVMFATAVAGCDQALRTFPTAPSSASGAGTPTADPPVAGAITLAGSVSDAAWRPLTGALVEVVDGPSSGMRAVTDARGQFHLTGLFDEHTHFQASKEGHLAAAQLLPPRCEPCNPKWWLHFYLATVAAPVNLAGEYTLTISADPRCSLPESARTRSYSATISARDFAQAANSRFLVTVSGGSFLADKFDFGVAGNFIKTDIGDWGHGQPGIVERVSGSTFITIGGEFSALVTDPSTIAGSLNGSINQCTLGGEFETPEGCNRATPPAQPHCFSRDHRLVLQKR